MPDIDCANCNKSVYKHEALIKRNKHCFCSQSCKGKHQKNVRTVKERFSCKHSPNENGCWIWHACRSGHGYGMLRVDNKVIYAHRLSWTFRYGEIPDGLFVCHTCDVPACVNPLHLFLGTHADNVRDLVVKGLKMRGENSPSAILTEENVRRIRKREVPSIQLAREFGVSHYTISLALHRKTWAHVK